MDEKTNDNQFFFLISFFSSWGWQTLGKIPDPSTGKMTKNLVVAKQVIDLFEMLRAKTQGNLTEQEEKILSNTLADLQLNYVEELKKESEDSKKKDSEESASTEKTEQSKPDDQPDKPLESGQKQSPAQDTPKSSAEKPEQEKDSETVPDTEKGNEQTKKNGGSNS